MPNPPIHIGILGFGTVGSGAFQVLTQNAEDIARKVGAPVIVTRILVRDKSKPRDIQIDPALLTTDPSDILNDPDISIVCELMGGLAPAQDYVLRALKAYKNVVTANKEMMAKVGYALLKEAHARHLDFGFEGAVAGGIPIIQPLTESLAGNRFTLIIGIVNGTTNYILSKMAREDAPFAAVLAEAQAHGYAEPDPTADIEGHDAQYKTAILASLAFASRIDIADVYVEGITKIAPRDIEVAKQLGYVIKLLGIGQRVGDALQVRVHPALLPQSHPLASVNDVYNAVFLRGDAVGDVMFYGRGAGALPTGSAVAGDVIATARNIQLSATGRLPAPSEDYLPALSIERLQTNYYIRLLAHDRPKVLASLAAVFGDFDVSIESVVQRALPDGDAEIVWITHRCLEANLRSALDVMGRLNIVTAVQNWIRVEE